MFLPRLFFPSPAVFASAGGGAFDPSDLSVAIWFDASDLSTMYEERTGASATTPSSVDGVVGSWFNKGTSGGWAVAPADSKRPLLRQSGSLYYLEPDGVDDKLEFPTGTDLDGATIYTAACFMASTDVANDYERICSINKTLFDDYDRQEGACLILRNSASTTDWCVFRDSSIRESATLNASSNPGTANVVETSETTASAMIAVNGGTDSTTGHGAMSNFDPDNLNIFDASNNNAHCGMNTFQIIIDTAVPSSSDRALIVSFLNGKCGL